MLLILKFNHYQQCIYLYNILIIINKPVSEICVFEVSVNFIFLELGEIRSGTCVPLALSNDATSWDRKII